MEKDFKHPQIFSDLLMFYKRYYPIHAGLPKPFRFTTGESILTEVTHCLKLVTLTNQCDKSDPVSCSKGSDLLGQLRASIEVMTFPSFFTCNQRESSCYQHLLSFR